MTLLTIYGIQEQAMSLWEWQKAQELLRGDSGQSRWQEAFSLRSNGNSCLKASRSSAHLIDSWTDIHTSSHISTAGCPLSTISTRTQPDAFILRSRWDAYST